MMLLLFTTSDACLRIMQACNVKRRSSVWTSLATKSAPMVAFYWMLNLLT